MDENRVIRLADLQKGDHIVVSCYSSLRFYKVVRDPLKDSNRAKVSERVEDRASITSYSGTQYTHNYKVHIHTWEDHNNQRYVDLSDHDILLVKRETAI